MGEYIRLTEYKNAKEKEEQFLKAIKEQSQETGQQIRYTANQKDFEKIPGSPIAYWVSDRVKEIFETSQKFREISEIKQGMSTADNDKYLRYWHEIARNNLGFGMSNADEARQSLKKWFPYNKGGEFCKWYGNDDYVVNWENNGKELKDYEKSVIRNEQYFFRSGITWSAISSSNFGVRIKNNGSILGGGSNTIFAKNKEELYLLGFLTTKITFDVLNIINPTLNFSGGVIENLPIIFPKEETTKTTIDTLTQQCIDIAKAEWDSRETSWDFNHSPLVPLSLIKRGESVDIGENIKISSIYDNLTKEMTTNFIKMHQNEEELNRLFIEIYELQDEMTPDVDADDITLYKKEIADKTGLLNAVKNDAGAHCMCPNAPPINPNEIKLKEGHMQCAPTETPTEITPTQYFNKTEIIKQFISYAVGVIMGRYSLDKPGLIMANSDDKLIIENAGAHCMCPNNEIISNDSVGVPLVGTQINDTKIVKEGHMQCAPTETPTIKITDHNGNIRHEIPNASFIPDSDGIIPILDKDYFDDDITNRFIELVKIIYGEATLEENLLFIAEALDKKKTETSKECIRRYFLNEFMKDHMQRYNKRPIYWLFQSNKKGKAFNALVYLHRYEENTVGRIRQDYMLKYQSKLEAELKTIAKDIEVANGADRKTLEKEEKNISEKINEIRKYDEKIKYYTEHKIKLDLDDGVKVNYGKLYDVLYEEAGLKP